MSREALADYNAARDGQRDRNEARRIRTRINDARGSRNDAGVRWPFELLQNALDAGPRPDRELVEIRLRTGDGRFTFEHDGAPFSLQELAALLSGGSSKDFDSTETTGRFGTGFLVTHVLAPRTRVSGLFDSSSGIERFSLVLDRDGDEEAIAANIEACKEAIGAASPVTDLDTTPSAEFEYITDDGSALELGLASFRAAVPYLFATCPLLGRVVLAEGEQTTETWCAEPPTARTGNNVEFVERAIHRVDRGGRAFDYRVIRAVFPKTQAAAIVALLRTQSGWQVLALSKDFSRVFCRYPIRSSAFLPINVVLDAPFDVDQERHRIHADKASVRELFRLTLKAAVSLTALAFEQAWQDRYLLARAAPSPSSFAGSEDKAERQWLTDELRAYAEALARLPLVETRKGLGVAIATDAQWYADFLNPRLVHTDVNATITVERMWSLVDDDEDRDPPVFELAGTWSEIAEEWSALNVDVSRVCLHRLAADVRREVSAVEELRVRCDKHEWLARFAELVAESCERQDANPSVLEGLLPDQFGRLVLLSALKRDAGIPALLKDIGDQLELNVRRRLLDTRIVAAAERLKLGKVPALMKAAVPVELTADEIVMECLARLDRNLPEDKPAPDSDSGRSMVDASVRLLAYLADKGHAATEAFRVPLVASDGTIVRASQQRRMMAPVSTWREGARAFRDVYPPDRVLAELYAEDTAVVRALVGWGVAYADPLSRDAPAELRDDRLRCLAINADDAIGAHVARAEFSQIALLHPELFNRCERPEHARALLGLVLSYIAPLDSSWRSIRRVDARRAGAPVFLDVRGALWLADLQWRAWVPARSEEGKTSKVVASPDSLKQLLDPSWLHDNRAALELLGQFFGFDALELQLLSAAPDEELRHELRDRIARIVEVAGSDPGRYEKLLDHLHASERQERLVKQCRQLGRAIQDAIGEALVSHNLRVKVVDHGFDFEVETLEDAAGDIEVGSFLVEVKATTTGDAKLTPKQAEVASKRSDRFVLCVVDLRGVSSDRLDQPWSAAEVLALARMVPGIGSRVESTWKLVSQARGGEVAIRNEGALRYAVASGVWENGSTIGDWVSAAFKR